MGDDVRRKTLIWLAAALIGGIGAQCKDTGGGPHNDPFPPPPVAEDNRSPCPNIQFRADYERCFTLQTFVESRLGPYDVYLNIAGGTGAYPPHIPIAAGGWSHGIVYRSGVKLTITMTLELAKPGSKDGFCSITDGSEYVKDKINPSRLDGGGPHIAICVLRTSQ